MNVRSNKKLMLAAAVVIMLNFNSCNKYDDGPTFSLSTKKARLTTRWRVVEIENKEQEDVEVIFEFYKNGDFEMSYKYDAYSYSYDGKWVWENNKEVIEVSLDGDKEEWKVKRLTNYQLWFEDENNDLWKCNKK